MTYDRIVEIVKQTTANFGITEYELYYDASSNTGCETFQQEIDSFTSGASCTMQMRVVKDGKMGVATTELVSEEEIEALIARAVENATVTENDDKPLLYAGGAEYKPVAECPEINVSAAELKAFALEGAKILYAADSRMSDGTACAAEVWTSEEHILNSNGLNLSRKGSGSVSYMMAALDNGTEKQMDYKMHRSSFDEMDREAVAKEIAEAAASKFGAGAVKTGNYDIVIDRKAMTQILGTFLSSFYADSVQKGLSPLTKEKLGTEIASSKVTITDDPFFPGNNLQMNFDGEGVPTYTKNIIENGQLKLFLHNLTTALKDGVQSTGNGQRSGAKITTGYSNLLIQPGTLSKDDLLSMADGGVYVTEMKGFHAGADLTTGDFSIESAGFMIEEGKVGRAVKSFTVAGNFFALLKDIEELDNNIDTNGHAYRRIMSPDVLVRGMAVAGE